VGGSKVLGEIENENEKVLSHSSAVTFLLNFRHFSLSVGCEFVEALIKEIIKGSWSLVIYQNLLLLRLNFGV